VEEVGVDGGREIASLVCKKLGPRSVAGLARIHLVWNFQGLGFRIRSLAPFGVWDKGFRVWEFGFVGAWGWAKSWRHLRGQQHIFSNRLCPNMSLSGSVGRYGVLTQAAMTGPN